FAWQMDTEMRAFESYGGALEDVDQFRTKARLMMYNGTINSIFNFDQNTRNAYGNSAFGNACIAARNLIKTNVGARFIQISFGSWDHHNNIYAPNTNLKLLSRQFDAGVASMIAYLNRDCTYD